MRGSSPRKVLENEACYEIIRKKLRQDSMDHFAVVKYEIIPVNEVHGYMGQYFTLKATVACAEAPSETRVIHFFTKIPPPITSPQYDYMQEYGSFGKEVALYTTVFPLFLNGMDMKCIPQCFLGLDNDVIVLEDMAHRGYTMANKFVPFDFDHCEVIMKTLARFHSKSFIYEANRKENLCDVFSHCMHETLWPLKDGRGKRMFEAAVKGVVSMIDLIPDLSEEAKRNFQMEVTLLAANHASGLLPSKRHKNVLCHGDLWANNILFKYDGENKPTECCLVDFQLARYNPPAHDILCFLQFTTTRELRDKHSGALFKIYHENVASALHEANLDISKILPWSDFIRSIDELRTMCMTHGVLNTPIMLLKSDAAKKYFCEEPELLENALYVDRTPLICGQYKDIPVYRDRMMDALLELYDRVVPLVR